ncbi:hypothetical protein KFE25_000157 [Diacronema lutheri]|uniref:Uncharacterized protein n=2 Tax=Diacronema lutheri TaxID=2081491 RepID=A0A8J6C8V7_DIALT|nr:hypothetical protein KFE25_000157 [Diacronema lutheri]
MPVTFAGANIWALGASVGLLVHAFSNRVRKVKITRRPWEIPIAAIVGGYAFQWWDGVCERAEEKTAAIVAVRLEANKEVVKPPMPTPMPKY